MGERERDRERENNYSGVKQKRAQRKYNLKAHLVELCSQTLCCAIAGQGSLTEDFGLTSWVRWSCWFLFKPYRVSLSLCRISSQVSRKGNHSGLRIHAEVQIGWTVSKQAVANAICNLHRKWKEKSEFFPFFSSQMKRKKSKFFRFFLLFCSNNTISKQPCGKHIWPKTHKLSVTGWWPVSLMLFILFRCSCSKATTLKV